MTRIRLKHIDHFVDRHGKWRYYYRPKRGARVALPGEPGSPEFMAAYEKAARGEPVEAKVGPRLRGEAGTFARLLQDYFSSPDFLSLASSTQRAYRRVMENWVLGEGIGHRRVAEMRREHVAKMMAKRAATPGAANDLLKKIRILTGFAIVNGHRTDDPTLKMKKYKAGEWHTWTEDEIAQFEARWPEGTRERLVFALHLYTGQRVSDVTHMQADDLGIGTIRVTQIKTKAKLDIPLHPVLKRVLELRKHRVGPLARTSFGKPFSEKGLANYMADAIGKAGLPDRCVTHGLRKAAARRLAEAGCSVHEIMSITGHQTLGEVERYTKAAEQKRLARAAIDRLSATGEHSGFPNPDTRVGKEVDFSSKFSGIAKEWRTGKDSNPRPPDS